MNQYRNSVDSLYEIPKQPARNTIISTEEATTREMFKKLDNVKKSTVEYAKPFLEHAREYLVEAKANQRPNAKWKPKTVGQNNEDV